MPDGLRVATGLRVAEAMNWAGRKSGGAYALALAASKIADPKVKAQLLDDAVSQEFGRGVVPDYIDKAVQELLDFADDSQAAGRYEESSMSLERALRLGFHRVVHIDQLSSPLAEDPEAFIKRFHRSRAMQTVLTPGAGTGRPRRRRPTARCDCW
ncbi:hypothetical protein GCM10029992_03510 [Glycomyces albus]